MRVEQTVGACAIFAACAGQPNAQRSSTREAITTHNDSGATVAATDDPLPLADWLPHAGSRSAIVRSDATATWIVDGPFRAIVREGGRIEVARDRPRLDIDRWFALEGDRWVFVTRDGLVLSSQGFLGSFATRAELRSSPAESTESGFVGAASAQTIDGRWWVLDDPARPRALESSPSREFYAMRFFDRERALALRSPGLVLLSSDGGRSWGALEMRGDVPLALEGRQDRRVVVRGARSRWALDGRRVFGRLVREEPDVATDAARVERSIERWRVHKMRSLPRVFVDTNAPISGSIDGSMHILVGTTLYAATNGPEPARLAVESGNDCAWAPFGATLAALCRGAGPRARVRTVAREPLAMNVIETPFELSNEVLVARDGTIIVHKSSTANELQVWTQRTGWQTRATAAPLRLLDANNGQILAANEHGLFTARADRDGSLELRQVARFEARDAPRYSHVFAASSHETLRSWVLADTSLERCAVLLEDERGAVTVDLPRCEQTTSVLFLDRRFGVVANADTIFVTRDGQRWQTHEREVVNERGQRVQLPLRRVQPGFELTRAYALGDSVVVPPWQRVTRDGLEHAVSASVDSGPDDERAPEPMLPAGAITCVERSAPSSTRENASERVLTHSNARVAIGNEPTGESSSLRWSYEGRERGRWRGARPWSAARATDIARWRIACASADGVVIERCVSSNERRGRSACESWLLREGAAEPLRLSIQSPPADVEPTLAACAWAEHVWQLEFRDQRVPQTNFTQRQLLSASGAVVRWSDVVRTASEPVAMVLRDGAWSWAEQTIEPAQLRVVPYERGPEQTLSPISSIAVCRGDSNPERRWFMPRTLDLMATLGPYSVGVRLQLAERGGAFCIESVTDDPIVEHRPSAQIALSLHASRDGRLRGTWSTYADNGAASRRTVECRWTDPSSPGAAAR